MPIRWRRDGKELLKSGRPVKMFDRADAHVFDVSADGQRFLVVHSGSGRTLTLLQNWNRAPKR